MSETLSELAASPWTWLVAAGVAVGCGAWWLNRKQGS